MCQHVVSLLFCHGWVGVELVAQALDNSYSPVQVVWSRYAAHLLIMVSVWGWRRPALLLRTDRPCFQIARSMLMVTMPAFWVMSLRYTENQNLVVATFGLSPLIVLSVSGLCAKKIPTLMACIIAGSASLGSVMLGGRPMIELNGTAHAAAFMATFSFSLYFVMTGSRPPRWRRWQSLRQ